MKKFRNFLMMALFSAGTVLPAAAGEGLFSYTYTTDTTPAGHFEFEQMIRNRAGRADGSYSAEDFSTELEYGITDNFQGAFYVNTERLDAYDTNDDDALGGDGDVVPGKTTFSNHATFLQSLSLELVYRLLSPYQDGIGVALYWEPEIDFTDMHNGLPYAPSSETEYKLLLQKNFLEDKLVVAFNATAEFEFLRFEDIARNQAGPDTEVQGFQGELDFNNDFGISYRFAPGFFAGLEMHNHNEYADFWSLEHSVIWAGPDVHYAGEGFWFTLGMLKQVYGTPNGTDENGIFIGNGEFLRSHEDLIMTLKVGIPL